MFPAVLDPALMLMGWALVAAGVPGVVVAIIAMISADPNGFPVRARTTTLVDGMGRPNLNHYLGHRSYRGHRDREQYCKCNFLHGNSPRRGLGVTGILCVLRLFAHINVERREELRTRRMPRMSRCSTRRFQCDVPHCSRLLLLALIEFGRWLRAVVSVAQGTLEADARVQQLCRGQSVIGKSKTR